MAFNLAKNTALLSRTLASGETLVAATQGVLVVNGQMTRDGVVAFSTKAFHYFRKEGFGAAEHYTLTFDRLSGWAEGEARTSSGMSKTMVLGVPEETGGSWIVMGQLGDESTELMCETAEKVGLPKLDFDED